MCPPTRDTGVSVAVTWLQAGNEGHSGMYMCVRVCVRVCG